VTADLFADADLREFASTTCISPYPEGCLDWLRAVEPPAWMYTGALENHPELIDQMAWIAPLWGNAGDVLTEVRDPLTLATSLREAGHQFPETRTSPVDLPLDGSWLAKTYRGASGSGVRAWNGARSDSPDAARPYYQQRVLGIACAAVYAASEGAAVLLGIAKQLIDRPWLHGSDFQYAGSIAPISVSERAYQEVGKVGRTLAERFDLVGLFGVDFMIDGDQVWVLEVNPRYTASVEVLERATGRSALEAHAASCRGEPIAVLPTSTNGSAAHGKAIVFAERSVTISRPFFTWALAESRHQPWPALADISPVGTAIACGRPALTVFAEGRDEADVERRIQARVSDVESRLYGT
jgi:predicted ATP-grasp superfamily ATP-dependent carboligase